MSDRKTMEERVSSDKDRQNKMLKERYRYARSLGFDSYQARAIKTWNEDRIYNLAVELGLTKG